jgi:hypothetical protein
MSVITGDESPADILRMSLERFSSDLGFKDRHISTEIVYSKKGVPYLILQARVKNDEGEFVCHYRLDRMLLRLFPECERMYDEADAAGLFGEPDEAGRRKTVRNLARYAMTTMLSRLIMLQLAMFEDAFNDMMLLASSTLFDSLTQALDPSGGAIKKAANESVRTLLDKTVDNHAKKKRELLTVLLNSLPMLQIPVGVGRPKGSTKPEDVKAQEAAEYEKKVEAAIRKLISPKGKMPTKKAVAKELGIGGLSAGGTDSSLTNFSRKLRGLKIDYDAIVERVNLDK